MGEEGEGDEAELLAVFDLLRTASVNGGERRRALPEHGHGARVRVRGKMREGEREQTRGGLLIHLGSAAVSSWCGADAGDALGRY